MGIEPAQSLTPYGNHPYLYLPPGERLYHNARVPFGPNKSPLPLSFKIFSKRGYAMGR